MGLKKNATYFIIELALNVLSKTTYVFWMKFTGERLVSPPKE
jgi:hypothetical protein